MKERKFKLVEIRDSSDKICSYFLYVQWTDGSWDLDSAYPVQGSNVGIVLFKRINSLMKMGMKPNNPNCFIDGVERVYQLAATWTQIG